MRVFKVGKFGGKGRGVQRGSGRDVNGNQSEAIWNASKWHFIKFYFLKFFLTC